MITGAKIDGLAGGRVLVVGDLMLDRWISGTVERISPEAPVPVVRQTGVAETIGGAGLVLQHLKALGAEASLVTVVGSDIDWFARGGNDDGWLMEIGRRSTVKTRVIADGQQVVRIDEEGSGPIAEGIEERLLDIIRLRLEDCDAVAIADYGKGVCTPKIARALVGSGKPVLVDAKTRWVPYAGATAIKCNRRELGMIVNDPRMDDAEMEKAARALLGRGRFGAVCVTLGGDGLMLVQPNSTLRLEAYEVGVRDVVGAGDAVLAGLALATAARWRMTEAAAFANACGACAVSSEGTTPIDPWALKAMFPAEPEGTAYDLARAEAAASEARKQGRKVIVVNGCFDGLHEGHLYLIRRARAAHPGALLVVLVDDDVSVTRLKGDGRPQHPQEERAAALAALPEVDHVAIVRSVLGGLTALRPDAVWKGSDHIGEDNAETRFVRGYGGEVLYAARLPGVSTTERLAAEAGR